MSSLTFSTGHSIPTVPGMKPSELGEARFPFEIRWSDPGHRLMWIQVSSRWTVYITACHVALLEQKLSTCTDDAHFGAFARSAAEFGDGFDDTQIVVAQYDGQFIGCKSVSRSTCQGSTL